MDSFIKFNKEQNNQDKNIPLSEAIDLRKTSRSGRDVVRSSNIEQGVENQLISLDVMEQYKIAQIVLERTNWVWEFNSKKVWWESTAKAPSKREQQRINANAKEKEKQQNAIKGRWDLVKQFERQLENQVKADWPDPLEHGMPDGGMANVRFPDVLRQELRKLRNWEEED